MLANSICSRRALEMAAQKYGQMFRTSLIQVQIKLWHVRLRKRFGPRISDDADYGNPRRTWSRRFKAFAQRFLVRPVSARECFVHYRHLRSGIVVELGEQTAT